jgi:cytochrome c nitrite reductase small subunit
MRIPRARATLALLTAASVGAFIGVGVFTFGYGGGTTYFSNDPSACANCHIMQGHYDAWQASSHKHVATCNDCHLSPHPIGQWITKADNGFFHSLAFTTGDFHEPIQIKPRNRRVTQSACLHCHGEFVHNMLPAQHGGDMLNCVHCHREVGHNQR